MSMGNVCHLSTVVAKHLLIRTKDNRNVTFACVEPETKILDKTLKEMSRNPQIIIPWEPKFHGLVVDILQSGTNQTNNIAIPRVMLLNDFTYVAELMYARMYSSFKPSGK